ncbi:ribosome maturation factor RimM [Heyndrickxia coagulans]|jgi:16S rRNA processing protein RimM|uniref:ribosome maturation factor RimM n=1 Tax=Heyndrickxia TaxID=2837504 RepID=UPI000E473A7D|nr:ribosome maturation factor RimM [Heyndrickxia coagulans]MBF8418602.1 ribosome maturation factor RimM [Heyndrickxia coagulans]MEC5267658.1 ribosome maturation factor RimM [Heyndrickxia coagulans]MED4934539.1 ribosome maturation factor RimM [Heyndrickxia coagulans]MED4966642.1 ribosome maturation factor RimM [Heyndrickxia coagulans]RGR87475.1 ribosome maturation factor RimM [Heyndrickxia coagulans]
MTQWFNVGKIVNTHGIRGEVRVISKTDFKAERYKPGNTLYLFLPGCNEPVALTIESHRVHKQFDLLKFEGFDSIGEAEKWKGGMLKVSEEQLNELGENEFYFHEIIGCEVVTTAGEKVGTVKEILTPGANDVWVVKTAQQKEALIPYIEDVVKKVDKKEKRIVIEPMEGLLP